MAREQQYIPNMPTGSWIWEGGKGQPYWYTKNGQQVLGYGKHMHNVQTGENLPVRQGQEIQKAEERRRGIVRPPPAKREYARAIRHRPIPAAKGRSARHGRTINIYYHNLEDAYNDFHIEYNNPNSFIHAFRAWVIEISWEDKLAVADTNTSKKNRIGTGKLNKQGKEIFRTAPLGYATLTKRWYSTIAMGTSELPWEEAIEREMNYQMGTKGRIILFGGEK